MYRGFLIIIIILAFVFGISYYGFDVQTSETKEVITSTVEQDAQLKKEREISLGKKLKNQFYRNYETRPSTEILFNYWNKPEEGTLVFIEGGALDDTKCRFRYSYVIDNNQINATFLECDCVGRTTTDRIFYYDEERDVISTNVDGETFEFAKDGNPHQKHWSNNRQPEQEQQTNSNESGYYVTQDGRLNENASCSLCNGTGIERAINSTGNDRICPQCEGRGHQSY